MIQASLETREIRVFVSSTFSDMHSERDYLNKHVFPALRKLCQQRSVVFTEVDLQWGITDAQAEDGGAIEVCLNEIDRCHPYFIGILGERYGWSPKDSGLSTIPVRDDALKQRVNHWAEAGESVTAMEIMHGVLDNPAEAPYAYFYFRNDDYTHILSTQYGDNQDAGYFETDNDKKKKLSKLKSRITDTPGACWQVRNEGGGYSSIQAFGDMVRSDLEAAINDRFPEGDAPDFLQRERNMHAAFAKIRSSFYIADDAVVGRLLDYFEGDCTPLVITGDMGVGKSALLANFTNDWKSHHKNHFVIEHFAGSGGESDAAGVLRRIIAEIKSHFRIADDLPHDNDGVFRDFAFWLGRVPRDMNFLLVLDGVNQFIGAAGELRRFVHSIPQHAGDHINIILSVLDGEALDAVHERGWRVDTVSPLDSDRRKALVDGYLQHFRKALPQALLARLVGNIASQNPLYLRIILDELRVDATHGYLADRLESYLQTSDPVQLFSKVIARWEKDYGQELVQQVLALIWVSRDGLSEIELRSILLASFNKRNSIMNKEGGLPRQLATLIYGMGDYLADREGLYGFMHDALRQAVAGKYMTNTFEQSCRQMIVDYFSGEELEQRKINELPWQLLRLDQLDALKSFFSEPLAIAGFTKRYNWKEEVLAYWYSFTVQDREEIYQNFLLHIYYEELRVLNIGLRGIAEILYDWSMLRSMVWHSSGDKPSFLFQEAMQMFALCNDDEARIPYYTLCAAKYLEDQELDKARNCLIKAYRVARQRFGEDAVETVSVIIDGIEIMIKKGRFEDAFNLLKKYREEFQRVPALRVKILDSLVYLHEKSAQWTEAREVLKELICLHQKMEGIDSLSVAKDRIRLGWILTRLELFSEAKDECISAVNIFERSLSAHPELAGAYALYEELAYKMGDEEAIADWQGQGIEVAMGWQRWMTYEEEEAEWKMREAWELEDQALEAGTLEPLIGPEVMPAVEPDLPNFGTSVFAGKSLWQVFGIASGRSEDHRYKVLIQNPAMNELERRLGKLEGSSTQEKLVKAKSLLLEDYKKRLENTRPMLDSLCSVMGYANDAEVLEEAIQNVRT